MFCDIFRQEQVSQLLKGKRIWFVGSSNMRAIYKDLLWLITYEHITPTHVFKMKNEPIYVNDKRISNDVLHNGRYYKETREYKLNDMCIMFHFITKLYIDHFVELIDTTEPDNFPDVLFINSCLWDLTRWGPDGPENYKVNVLKTMKFLKDKLPQKTRVIWKTALPVSITANGAIFIDEIKYIVPMLPWHILEANTYASTCAYFFNFDVLDFHHHMRLQGHLRVKDGIHWQPLAVRYLTNLFLTHLCLTFEQKLPGNIQINPEYLLETTRMIIQPTILEDRVNKKQGFFNKLFKKTGNGFNKNRFEGVTNKVLSISKNIFKPKRKNMFKNKIENIRKRFHRNNLFQDNNYTMDYGYYAKYKFPNQR